MLAEEYRKLLFATYVHISDTYESYEDFLMASFSVEMKDDAMELTSELPEEDLIELRRRIAATNWPEKETVSDHSQGVPFAMMQELASYWATDYDWRKCEAALIG